ncbi:glycosyltransferase [Methylorubrum salsuginis]|uniref:Glycosyltransferase, GT2 family n=1 Tax=Methylorubrum salsuginis TaxID=414703 RepID=A0A1I4LRE4_9HYPH|nr:glycosyltransferase family A protein [Methylorubrum salsuginis]SFL93580.1 Glycosyltransferase, GT2 family [Methylorubrum salsuginis]
MSDLRRAQRTPVLGLVAIGRNEGERLRVCLVSAADSGCRIVYVDSGSQDGSVALAAGLGATVVTLDDGQPFTAARARNAGFAALCACEPGLTYVQFIDGDCTLAPSWLAAAVEILDRDAGIAAVCGRRRERHRERTLFNRLCDMEWDGPTGIVSECGGDVLMRACAFREAGGYRGSLIAGEEPELCVRLRQSGWTIRRLPAEMTAHDAAMMRFRQWWRRAVRAGYAFAEVSRLHRGEPCAIWAEAVPRAVFWGGLLPLAALLPAALYPATLGFLLIYPLQIGRIAFRRGARSRDNWLYAGFALLAKLPELEGILRFHADRRRGRGGQLIEYKQACPSRPEP